jgi:L-iditol 2-dehydrogenase
MRAARQIDIGRIELFETEKPDLSHGTDVLLKIEAVGLCGTDRHYFVTGKVGGEIIKAPFVPGHEAAAVVEEVGAAVQRVKPGDPIVVDPAISCGVCDQCLKGRRHTCRNLRFLGYPGQMDGALGEWVVMPEANCFPAPELTAVQRILVEPLSIAIHSLQLAHTHDTHSIGILGCGPIGLSIFLAAHAMGIEKIYMTDPIPERILAADREGAHWTADPSVENIAESIMSLEPLGLDVVFECCGNQQAVDQGIEVLKPGGVLAIIGIPESGKIDFNPHKLRRNEITVANVRRQNNCIAGAVNLIKTGDVRPSFLATHDFSLDRVQEAFEMAASYRDGILKAIIRLD